MDQGWFNGTFNYIDAVTNLMFTHYDVALIPHYFCLTLTASLPEQGCTVELIQEHTKIKQRGINGEREDFI